MNTDDTSPNPATCNIRSVYLAGPGVFRRDAHTYGKALKHKCRALGFEPLWPLDNEPTATEPRDVARQLREMNCAMIRNASAVIADISPFRGPNMDPGTAFEIGYAVALGKPVFLYSDSSRTLLDRTVSAVSTFRDGSRMFDDAGMEIEDFGLSENLMIATVGRKIYGSYVEALLVIAR